MVSRLKLLPLLFLAGCAYFNTFYNAQQYFNQAQEATRENQTSQVSGEELRLYSKAIEKSKKVLQFYSDSKYADDAEFIIARSYFFRQDYGLAQRYFQELVEKFPNSPYRREIPLWLARCIFKQGDNALAKHEVRRFLKKEKRRKKRADGWLLLGKIAVAEDSLDLARTYLERVVEEAPDDATRAEAQFQIGELYRSAGNYRAALQAYTRVFKLHPLKSLKTRAIIAQSRMLKKLNMADKAILKIQTMLADEAFKDIKGALEVELGKIYLEQDRLDEALSRLTEVTASYKNQPFAAEASFYLGELYLKKLKDYKKALKAYQAVNTYYRKSPLVKKANERIDDIKRYKKIQLEYLNTQRALEGLPPLGKKKARRSRKRYGRRYRGRNNARRPGFPGPGGLPEEQDNQRPIKKKETTQERKIVTHEDSVRFQQKLWENRYALAEHMLFRFQEPDTALKLLDSIETNCPLLELRRKSSYMKYYGLQYVAHDSAAADTAWRHIQLSYPTFFREITTHPDSQRVDQQRGAILFRKGEEAFLSDDFKTARHWFQRTADDTTNDEQWRQRALFAVGWLCDHYLFDREGALAAYQRFLDVFPDSPLAQMVKHRLDLLEGKEVTVASPSETTRQKRTSPRKRPRGEKEYK